MDNHKNRKAYSFSNSSKIDRIKNKKDIRLRLIKLTNDYFKPRCEHYINNIRSFNLKVTEYSGGNKTVENDKNFHFGKKKDNLIYLTDLSSYKIDIIPFIKNLKNKFSREEIEIIKKDKEYYLTNELLNENISMFNIPPLYQIINKEEEDEKKGAKVFHNLNYFNKRRRNSIMNINNLIQKKTLDDNNKDNIEPINKKILKLGNKSGNNNIKNNFLNLIQKGIKNELKKKYDKSIFKGENIVSVIQRESENEVRQFLKDKKELDIKNKMSILSMTGKKKKKLPNIRNKTLSRNDKDINLDINLSKINKRKKSFSKEKKQDLTKKILDYEQKIIRDVNRRIKTIYENLNKNPIPNNE